MTVHNATQYMSYIKTTETCNLNCSHCFTNGINGRKIYFDPRATADFFNRLYAKMPNSGIAFEFHGGEPMLAPVEDMKLFHKLTYDVWGDRAYYGMTTNLTYKLTDEKLDLIYGILHKRLGTSYDPFIRWANAKQQKLWEDNVRQLTADGVDIKCFVSLSKDMIQENPADVIEYLIDLGIQEVDFERLTSDGNAVRNPKIFPTNIEIQDWYLQLHKETQARNLRDKIYNSTIESVYMKFEDGITRASTFCRDCEQKLFTINADGRIAGCPNSAPTAHYAHISDDIDHVLFHPSRMCNIATEMNRNSKCYECPVQFYCGGDCYKLAWEGDICPAPKTLMLELAP